MMRTLEGVGLFFTTLVLLGWRRDMSRKLILILLVVAVGAFGIFLMLHWNATPSGIETKGRDEFPAMQYAALGTSIVSLLTAIVGLAKTFLDMRQTGGRT